MLRVGGDEGFAGGDEGRERAFHVGSATAIEQSVADRRHERIGGPLVERAGRNDIRMAGEADEQGVLPRRAQRLVTPLRLMYSQEKPMAERRSAIRGNNRRPRE